MLLLLLEHHVTAKTLFALRLCLLLFYNTNAPSDLCAQPAFLSLTTLRSGAAQQYLQTSQRTLTQVHWLRSYLEVLM